MEFNNNGMGKCILLKEDKDTYSLVYALPSKQFIVVSNLDKETGEWLHGHYFGNDLESALYFFNEISSELDNDMER